MFLRVTGPFPPMPDRFKALADYNGEVARGLMHTPACEAEMARLQAEYREWQIRSLRPGWRIVS